MKDLSSDTGFHGFGGALLVAALLGFGGLLYLVIGMFVAVEVAPDISKMATLTLFVFIPLTIWFFATLLTSIATWLLIKEVRIPKRDGLVIWAVIQLVIGGMILIFLSTLGFLLATNP